MTHITNYTEARQGRARRGNARYGAARQGQQELRSCFIFNFHKSITNYTRRGLVWLGNVRRCMARQGLATRGAAVAQGFKTLCIMRKK